MKIGGTPISPIRIADLPCREHGSLSIPRTQIPALTKAFKPLHARLAGNKAHYVLDVESGSVRFGDGLHGARPSPGTNLVARYRPRNLRHLQSVVTSAGRSVDKIDLQIKKSDIQTGQAERRMSKAKDNLSAARKMFKLVLGIIQRTAETQTQATKNIVS